MKNQIEELKEFFRVISLWMKPAFGYFFAPTIFRFSNFKILKWYWWLPSILYSILLSLILLVFAIEINFLWLFGNMPNIDNVANPDLAVASEVYTADGVLIGKFFKENREQINYKEINPNVITALISTEDARFYDHWGIDIKGVAGAVYQTAQGDRRGGSTITQQLAKNLYRTRKDKARGILGYLPLVKTFLAKGKEWITAVKLEAYYTKEDILTMYLNTVEFGHNTYGISVAAKTFFGVKASELSINQSATLIGMLQAPTRFSPLSHPEACLKRRNIVLSQMKKYGKLSEEDYKKFSKEPLGINFKEYSYSEGMAPYFRTYIAKYLSDWGKERDIDIFSGGYKIITTLDSRMQRNAEEAVIKQMKKLQQNFNNHWGGTAPWMVDAKPGTEGFLSELIQKSERYKSLLRKGLTKEKIRAEMEKKYKMKIFTHDGIKEKEMSPIDSIKYYATFLHASLITIEPVTGQIKAYVGGINYDYFKYDHAGVALNQPGSTFKPFVYATAIEQGMSPCDRLPDLPITIKFMENGKEQEWTPHNADWKISGEQITLRHAMGRSVNTVTARLTKKVGWKNVAKTARKMGITSHLDEVPSIGLGSNDVTLLEMVAAYAVFMNGGIYTEPMMVDKIIDRKGDVIAEFIPLKRRSLTQETAWLMTYMLRGGFEEPGGTSLGLWDYKFVRGNQVGGKTGTSSNYSDGWYMGVTKDYVTGVWVGADDNRVRFRSSETGEGARTALPVYGKYMDLNYADKSLGLTKGNFPDPVVKITRKHNCRTIIAVVDTAASPVSNDTLQEIPVENIPLEEVPVVE